MKMIQGGIHHSIGITQSGKCFVWVRIDGAKMGLDVNRLPLDDPNKDFVEYGRPRVLLWPTSLALLECIYAAASSSHSIVIASDGSAYSWASMPVTNVARAVTPMKFAIATLIKSRAINDKKFSWAGAGGQCSMRASACDSVGMMEAMPIPNHIQAS
jgi:regulator of chromosome condensation